MVEPKKIDGVLKVEVLFKTNSYAPYNPGETAWFGVKQANEIISRGHGRRSVAGDHSTFADVVEAEKPVVEPKKPQHSVNDFNDLLSKVQKVLGKRKTTHVLSFYDIEKDEKQRKQEHTNCAIDMFKAILKAGELGTRPPVIPPWIDKSLKKEFVSDWKEKFG
jgi:hypothetical protein